MMPATSLLVTHNHFPSGFLGGREIMLLSGTLRRIQDIMRRDPGLDGDAQRISQLSWILFLKIFDGYQRAQHTHTRQSALPQDCKWDVWTRGHHDVDGTALIRFVEDRLIPSLRKLSDNTESSRLLRSAFANVQNQMQSGHLLRDVITLVNKELDLDWRKDRHTIGDMYEQLLSDLQGAGNAGEFYTPRALTDFAVQMTAPKPGERVLDFACGVGGFLVSSINLMTAGIELGSVDFQRAVSGIRGVEKKSLPHFLCTTNLLLHGVATPEIIALDNWLARPPRLLAEKEKFDVIITNPPFGGAEESHVFANFPEAYRSRETADLFMLLLIDLLRQGGRAAIILPDGFLFGSGVKARIRRLLIETCDLHTIVRIPKGAFSPYTGISTNILFLRRGATTKKIWFYEHPYPSGRKSYSKTKPILLSEFDDERRWWGNRAQTPQAWAVPVSDLKPSDFNLDIRNPNSESERIADPDVSLKDLSAARSSLQACNGRLREVLSSYFSENTLPALIPDHLELITGTPGGIDRLRQLVLAFAMTGHLKYDRESSGSQKRINKRASRCGNRLFDIEEAGAVTVSPHGWTVARMDQIADVIGGGTPRTNDETNFSSSDGIPWVTPADLNGLRGKYVAGGRRYLSESGLNSSSARLLPAGAVLFSTRAPIGYVAIASRPLATNQGFKSLVPREENMSEYLYYYLLSATQRIEESASGTTFKEVPSRAMKALRVEVPPVDERNHVVKCLNLLFTQLDECADQVEESRRAQAIAISDIFQRATENGNRS